MSNERFTLSRFAAESATFSSFLSRTICMVSIVAFIHGILHTLA